MASLHPLLDQWLAAVSDTHLEGLVRLYHDQAVVRGFSEELRGTAEILDHLTACRRQLRKMALSEIRALQSDDRGLSFETVVHSLWGEKRVRHAWTLQDDRIAHHDMQLVAN